MKAWLDHLARRAGSLRQLARSLNDEADCIDRAIAGIRAGRPIPLNFLNAREKRVERMRRAAARAPKQGESKR